MSWRDYIDDDNERPQNNNSGKLSYKDILNETSSYKNYLKQRDVEREENFKKNLYSAIPTHPSAPTPNVDTSMYRNGSYIERPMAMPKLQGGGLNTAPILPKVNNYTGDNLKAPVSETVPNSYVPPMRNKMSDNIGNIEHKTWKETLGTTESGNGMGKTILDALKSGIHNLEAQAWNIGRMMYKGNPEPDNFMSGVSRESVNSSPDFRATVAKAKAPYEEDHIDKFLNTKILNQEKKAEDLAKPYENDTGLRKILGTAFQSIPQTATAFINLPAFALMAGSGYQREAEKDGATYEQSLKYGAIGGILEAATEYVPAKIFKSIGTKVTKEVSEETLKKMNILSHINKGAEKLFGKYGEDGVKVLGEILAEFAQEAGIDPLTNLAKKSIYKPDMAMTGKGGVFDYSQMKQDGIGGIAMAVILMGLGLPPRLLAHKVASSVIENKTKLDKDGIQTLGEEVKKGLENLSPEELKEYDQTTEAAEQKIDINNLAQTVNENVNPLPTSTETTPEASIPLKEEGQVNVPNIEKSSVEVKPETNSIVPEAEKTKIDETISKLEAAKIKTETPAVNNVETQTVNESAPIPETKEEAVVNKDFNKIKEEIKKDIKDFDAKIIKPKDRNQKNIVKLMKGLGVDVHFYEATGTDVKGFVYSKDSRTLYLNSASGKNEMLNTTGHEFFHTIKTNHSEEFTGLLGFAKEHFDQEAREKYLETYKNVPELQKKLSENEDALLEEMLADELGNNFTNKDFWQNLYEHSKDLFNKLVDIAAKLIKKIGNVESYDTYISDETVSKLSSEFEKTIANIRAKVASGADLGIVDGHGDNLSPNYSVRTQTVKDKENVIEYAEKNGIANRRKVVKYLKNIDNVMAKILNDLDRLDYEPSNDYSALKPNADPHYKESLDFSTLCKKRLLLQGTIEKIQANIGRGLTQDEWVEVRNALNEAGQVVSCGACYVDSRRLEWGLRINQYVKNNLEAKKWYDPKGDKGNKSKWTDKPFPEDVPPSEWFYTQEGFDKIKAQYPEIYSNLLEKTGARGIKTPESRTEYRHEILKLSKGRVDALNSQAGLRWQSWSDFEVPHLMDGMQAIADMYAIGLKGHAYTKVEDFVRVFGKTGMMINMSLIPKGKGVDESGNLIFDSIEGMDFEVTKKYRDLYHNNVGTISIGVNDAQIRAALRSEFVDYVIPYHASGLSISKRIALGIGMEKWSDYTKYQNPIDKATKKKAKMALPDVYEVWDYEKTPKENADNYIKILDNLGAIAPFEQFHNEENYWKLLIDHRMINKNGENILQKPVVPEFDMEAVNDILDNYNEYHDKLPDHAETVEKLTEKFKQRTKSTTNSNFVVKQKKKKTKKFDAIPEAKTKEQVAAAETKYSGREKKLKPTETENFKNWFKDSKVVDKNGKPKIVYHGSGHSFEAFDKTKIPETRNYMGSGFYFSESKKYTDEYLTKWGGENPTRYDVALSIQNPFIAESAAAKELIPDYIKYIKDNNIKVSKASIEELKRYTVKKSTSEDLMQMISGHMAAMSSNGFRDFLQSKGYDGVFFKSGLTTGQKITNTWIAFESNQVKSVADNNGDFDPNNDNIKESVREKEVRKVKKSKFIENSMLNSLPVPDDMKEEFIAHPEWYEYVEKNNEETKAWAENEIRNRFNEHYNRLSWQNSLTSEEDTALAIEILRKYIENGENDKATRWSLKVAKLGRHTGRAIQYFSIMKKLSPEWTINHISKKIDSLRTEEDDKLINGEAQKTIDALREENKKKIDEVLNTIFEGKTVDELLNDAKNNNGGFNGGSKDNSGTGNDQVNGGTNSGSGNADTKGTEEDPLVQEEKTPEELLAEKIENHIEGEEKENPFDPIKVMVNTLYNVAKETLPEFESTATKMTPIDFIKLAMNNKAQYQETWDKAKDVVKEYFEDDQAALNALDEYFKQFLTKPFSEKQFSAALKQAMKSLNIKYTDLALKDYDTINEFAKDIKEQLIDKGMDETVAKELESYINEEFYKNVAQAKEDKLDAQYDKNKARDNFKANPKVTKSIPATLKEMENLGAFDSEKYKDKIYEKIDSLISKAMTELKINPNALIKESYEEYIKAQDKLIEYMLDGKLKDRNHDKLMSYITSKFSHVVRDSRQSKIQNMFAEKGTSIVKTPADILKELFNIGVFNVEKYADKTGEKVDSVVRKGFKDLGYSIGNKAGEKPKLDKKDIYDVIKDHYSIEKYKNTLKEKLIDKGMDTEDAALLEQYISDSVDRLTHDAKVSLLKKMLTIPQKIAGNNNFIDRVIKLSNLGAFDTLEYQDIIAEKYKFKRLTAEDMEKLKELARKAQEYPDGSREKKKALYNLISAMEDILPKEKLRYVNAFQTINLLLNTKTAMRNIVGNIMFGLVSHGNGYNEAMIDILTKTVGRTGKRTAVAPSFRAKLRGGKKEAVEIFLDLIENVNTNNIEDRTEIGHVGNTFTGKKNPLHYAERAMKALLDDRAFKGAEYEDQMRKAQKVASLNNESFNEAEAMEKAELEAQKVVFQDLNKLSDAAVWIKRKLNGGLQWGAGDVLLKFAKTPANIVKRAVEYLPTTGIIRLAKVSKDAIWHGKFDQEAFVKDMAKTATGLEIISMGYVLYKMGALLLSEPDKDKRNLEAATGKLENSINISAFARFMKRVIGSGFEDFTKEEFQEGDNQFTFDWAAPTATLIAIGAMSAKGLEEKSFLNTDMLSIASESMVNSFNGIFDNSMLSGLQKFLKAPSPAEGAMDLALAVPQTMIPFSSMLNQVRQLTDKSARETYAPDKKQIALNKVQNRLPMLSKKLEVQPDVLGRDKTVYKDSVFGTNNAFNVGINPSITAKYAPTKASKEALDINKKTNLVSQIPRVAPQSFKVNIDEDGHDMPIKLTTAEYVKYQRALGIASSKVLENASKYESSEDLAKEIANTYSDIEAAIKEKVMEERGYVKKKKGDTTYYIKR